MAFFKFFVQNFKPGEPRKLTWVSCEQGQVVDYAVEGGKDCGCNVYVIRAQHSGGVIPGKLHFSHPVAYIPYDSKEIFKPYYEVLTAPSNTLSWISTSGKNIHPDAIPGGWDPNREIYFIGRVHHQGTLTCGKVHTSHGVCYISYGGKEYGYSNYEILIRNELGTLLKI